MPEIPPPWILQEASLTHQECCGSPENLLVSLRILFIPQESYESPSVFPKNLLDTPITLWTSQEAFWTLHLRESSGAQKNHLNFPRIFRILQDFIGFPKNPLDFPRTLWIPRKSSGFPKDPLNPLDPPRILFIPQESSELPKNPPGFSKNRLDSPRTLLDSPCILWLPQESSGFPKKPLDSADS
ncbi:Hypothetical protein NTJ_12856 [Nesidiocoris tenuis]|nr:Hypothetical protein NTJ_12856 [Nesidiocoris tenuis]